MHGFSLVFQCNQLQEEGDPEKSWRCMQVKILPSFGGGHLQWGPICLMLKFVSLQKRGRGVNFTKCHRQILSHSDTSKSHLNHISAEKSIWSLIADIMFYGIIEVVAIIRSQDSFPEKESDIPQNDPDGLEYQLCWRQLLPAFLRSKSLCISARTTILPTLNSFGHNTLRIG